jgi:NOL1/NOP2/sun family putative RNA methylase
LSHTIEPLPSTGSVPDGVQAILARYQAIVDAPQALLANVQTPLPVCLWVNPLKTTPARLSAHLADCGVELEPVAWMPGAYRAADWPSPGKTLAFTAGWYYVQEEIAMTAVAALDPQPGDRILDLCAAPGGKTAQIALRLQGTGQVVANEWQAARLPSLSVTVSRLGLTNVLTLQGDGRSLPLPNHSFDRVLVDVPCSGEGNLRRRQQPRPRHVDQGARLATVQKKLLSRALDLVQPGGTVVYSTCTFAPEENEAVLDAVMGERAHLEAWDLPGLKGQPGLTRWQGQTYRADLTRARRYWPHQNNTGGFFVAKLRRTAAPALTVPRIAPVSLAAVPSGAQAPLDALCQRFALEPEAIAHHLCWATGKRRLWLATSDCLPLPGLLPQTLGIPLATRTNLGLKPSTAFLQRWAGDIRRHGIALPDHAAAERFVRGQSQPLQAAVETGYAQVYWKDLALGCGWYQNGQLQSQLPKALRWG